MKCTDRGSQLGMNDDRANADSEAEAAARAITCVVDLWSEAWNAHDIPTLASLVTSDVVFVTVAGKRLIGREEFRQHHQSIHGAHLRDSRWRTLGWERCHLTGRQLLAHIEWMILGERDVTDLPRLPRLG